MTQAPLPPHLAARKPPRQVTLHPSAFASDWGSAPHDDVVVGLRFVSVEDERVARATATQKAAATYLVDGKIIDSPAFIEAYNDEVIMCLVARALCDPNDVDRSSEFFPMAEATVPKALRATGVRRLWDELGILHAGSGVAIREADDEDVARLGRLLRRGHALGAAHPHIVVEARKLVTYLLSHLAELDPGVDDPEPAAASEGDDVAEYETTIAG